MNDHPVPRRRLAMKTNRFRQHALKMIAASVLVVSAARVAGDVVPTDGMVITTDTTFVPGTYNLPNGISIAASGVTLDGNGATIVGGSTGNGLTVTSRNNVVVRNLNVSGYFHGMHYHDCDEYWILFEGSGIAASEGKLYEVSQGDCVATGMGHHHDFPRVFEPVKAVYFETTLEGKKRRGHLWNHTHGQAEPRKERT